MAKMVNFMLCIFCHNLSMWKKKGPSSQDYRFSGSHVWMWELDSEESWALKNWWFWTVLLEKTLESPLDCKEIQLVHPKDQSWVFIGRTDAEAETPILWPPDAKSWLIGKDPNAGKDWRQEEKGTTEDEMAGWHHRLDGLGLSKLRELVMDREAWRATFHGVAESRIRLSDWTELNWSMWKLLSHVQFFATPQTCQVHCPWEFPGKNTKVGRHSSSRGSSQPRDWTQVSCLRDRFLTIWATT